MIGFIILKTHGNTTVTRTTQRALDHYQNSVHSLIQTS